MQALHREAPTGSPAQKLPSVGGPSQPTPHTRAEIGISDSVVFYTAILRTPIRMRNDRSAYTVVSAIYEAETLSVEVFKIQSLFIGWFGLEGTI